jgi:hypothetical protein
MTKMTKQDELELAETIRTLTGGNIKAISPEVMAKVRTGDIQVDIVIVCLRKKEFPEYPSLHPEEQYSTPRCRVCEKRVWWADRHGNPKAKHVVPLCHRCVPEWTRRHGYPIETTAI